MSALIYFTIYIYCKDGYTF